MTGDPTACNPPLLLWSFVCLVYSLRAVRHLPRLHDVFIFTNDGNSTRLDGECLLQLLQIYCDLKMGSALQAAGEERILEVTLTAALRQTGQEGKVSRMVRRGNVQPKPDPYQLLGLARQATSAEITPAWRRRARAEHPDARPWDVGAPARVPEPGPRAPRSTAGTAVRVIVLSPSGPPSPGRAARPRRSSDAGPAAPDGSGDAG